MRVADLIEDSSQFLTPGHTVEHAARRMLALDVSLVPVCRSDGTLVGMIDERDIVLKAVALGRAPELCAVGEIMRKQFSRCSALDDPRKIYTRMLAEDLERLPVVDGAGKLVGIVARTRLRTASASARPAPRVLAVERRVRPPAPVTVSSPAGARRV